MFVCVYVCEREVDKTVRIKELERSVRHVVAKHCNTLHLLQCVVVCCSVSQCVAVRQVVAKNGSNRACASKRERESARARE